MLVIWEPVQRSLYVCPIAAPRGIYVASDARPLALGCVIQREVLVYLKAIVIFVRMLNYSNEVTPCFSSDLIDELAGVWG